MTCVTQRVSIAVCVLLLIYFLFTSGMMFEMSHSVMAGKIDLPYSLALSGKRLNIVGVFNEDDVAVAKWLVDNKADVPLLADYNGSALLMGLVHKANQYLVPSKKDAGYYLFLTSWNAGHQMMVVGLLPGIREYEPLPELDKAVVVFSKGKAVVYYIGD